MGSGEHNKEGLWKSLYRRHVATGKHMCLLSRLVRDVFFSPEWSGGQTVMVTEAHVRG
jgi:hypothetical protein